MDCAHYFWCKKGRSESTKEAHKSCKILQAAVPKMSQTFSITIPILNRKVSDKFLWHYKFDGILFPGTASQIKHTQSLQRRQWLSEPLLGRHPVELNLTQRKAKLLPSQGHSHFPLQWYNRNTNVTS
jgi:hypothetical protein